MENKTDRWDVEQLLVELEGRKRHYGDTRFNDYNLGTATALDDAIRMLRSLHPAGSGTGREPVSWVLRNGWPVLSRIQVADGNWAIVARVPDEPETAGWSFDFKVDPTGHYVHNRAYDVLPLFTADALPGQGDGLREAAQALLTHIERIAFRDTAMLRLSAETTPQVERLQRALSRPQASAPPTPSEEEVEAAAQSAWEQQSAEDDAAPWEDVPEMQRILIRKIEARNLAAAYAVRDRK